MPTLFTRIIDGEIPGRFVWKDEQCVAFLSIHPIRPGHTLVVPRLEVDHWIALDPRLNAHLITVAQSVGRAIHQAFSPRRVGLMVAGLEVPHVHYHLVPIRHEGDLNFANADTGARVEDLDAAAAAIRSTLDDLGCRHGTSA
jgi:histidine triad (HIT) family protein